MVPVPQFLRSESADAALQGVSDSASGQAPATAPMRLTVLGSTDEATSLALLFQDGGSFFLEITVNDETLSPRIPVTSLPFALTAHNCLQLGGMGWTELADNLPLPGADGWRSTPPAQPCQPPMSRRPWSSWPMR